ncbi:cupin domain-containing protein [Streptomyces cyaneofuscatus]|uniref:cupin domain-containing protein n=1 Tax=Streptomyces cyaneofuscatus TaxID=66883 RepID=UPI002953FEB4|nr:cupin domain-containing protein [Streptomyces cyaneofuscatus]WOP07028.1 cupin domain-containing protein [Streptomyces cyaneofuscatus]
MTDPATELLRTLTGNSPPKTAPRADNQPLARGQVKAALPALGKDAEIVQVRRIVVPPGGTTGWHYHPGPLLTVVNQGVLTYTLARDLSTETVEAGQSFVEAAGSDHAHIGSNLGNEDLIMYTVYFLPSASSPLAFRVPAPGTDASAG